MVQGGIVLRQRAPAIVAPRILFQKSHALRIYPRCPRGFACRFLDGRVGMGHSHAHWWPYGMVLVVKSDKRPKGLSFNPFGPSTFWVPFILGKQTTVGAAGVEPAILVVPNHAAYHQALAPDFEIIKLLLSRPKSGREDLNLRTSRSRTARSPRLSYCPIRKRLLRLRYFWA